MPSHHIKELSMGNFLVTIADITLMDCIGDGTYDLVFIIEILMWPLFLTPGEFGVVYRAKVRKYKKEMAVKTLKG